jgi:hypothetical protein
MGNVVEDIKQYQRKWLEHVERYVSWTSTMASIFLYTNCEMWLRPTKDKMEETISIALERDLKPNPC